MYAPVVMFSDAGTLTSGEDRETLRILFAGRGKLPPPDMVPLTVALLGGMSASRITIVGSERLSPR
jgi:hypothetical protein